MKKWLLLALTSVSFALCAGDTTPANFKAGVVNFKYCVENSKLGQQEQATFEAMKKQMENIVEEKEKVLNDLANKLNNADELELMSPEAETDLKRKFRASSQEISQMQTQFYQTLNQANFQIIQKLSDAVAKATEEEAEAEKLDVVFNSEGAFYYNKALDISASVVKRMNAKFQETTPAPAA